MTSRSISCKWDQGGAFFVFRLKTWVFVGPRRATPPGGSAPSEVLGESGGSRGVDEGAGGAGLGGGSSCGGQVCLAAPANGVEGNRSSPPKTIVRRRLVPLKLPAEGKSVTLTPA